MKQLIQSVDAKLQSKTLELGDDAEDEKFVDDDVAASQKDEKSTSERYEPLAREPKHAKAQHTPLWELFALASHVHPYVSHGATRLLSAETFVDIGENPFQEFSTGEMLEQFAYASSRPRTKRGEQAAARLPYNSDKFMRRKNIAPHERFFHQYFCDDLIKEQQAKKNAARREREEDVDEEDDDGDAEAEDQFFEEHIREMMPPDEEDDPDMDDDSDDFDPDDDDEDDGEDDDPLRNESSGGSQEDDEEGADEFPDDGSEGDDDDDDDEGDSDSGQPQTRSKRKADEALGGAERAKAIRKVKRKHAGSMFASPEDFAEFLNEDFA